MGNMEEGSIDMGLSGRKTILSKVVAVILEFISGIWLVAYIDTPYSIAYSSNNCRAFPRDIRSGTPSCVC